MDIKALLKYRELWNQFTDRHPKFPAFLNAVKNRDIPVGTVAEISMKYPDGSVLKTNVRFQEEDIDIVRMFVS